jgi:hypothetical protein
MVDGGFTYHVKGKLVDKQAGDPVGGAMVYACLGYPERVDPAWIASVAVPVGPAGEFEFERSTGIAWSQNYLFGFIPLFRFGQVPSVPPLEKITLLLELKGRWYAVPAVPVRQEATGPAAGLVDVGTVAVRVDQLAPAVFVPNPWAQSRPEQPGP